MTDKDIEDALTYRLQLAANTLATIPKIIWENRDPATSERPVAPVAPYWVATLLMTPPARIGFSTHSLQSSRMIVDIMATKNTGTRTSREHAEVIKAHFPVDLCLPAGVGEVTVVDPTYADEGYRDGTYWRTKVHVRWQAIR
jgi:hypothetical protein